MSVSRRNFLKTAGIVAGSALVSPAVVDVPVPLDSPTSWKATAGVMKDTVILGGYQDVAFDFVADDPGMTLFHCHQQLRMDSGFMALSDYV